MTRQELADALEELSPIVEKAAGRDKILSDFWNGEIKVHFDFPPEGVANEYSILSISEKGILIRNHNKDKLVGH